MPIALVPEEQQRRKSPHPVGPGTGVAGFAYFALKESPVPRSQVHNGGPELLAKKSSAEAEPVRTPGRTTLHLELASEMSGLPKDLGIILIGLGALGIVIPGPIPPGASLVLLGAVVLFPALIKRLGWPAARLPGIFRLLISLVKRLRADLKRRYPDSVAR